MSLPHTIPGVWPASIPSSRFASLIRRELPDLAPPGAVALLGLPDDLGVRLNNGRPGAALAPAALRDALARYAVASPGGWSWPPTFDAGDITPAAGNDAASLDATHQRITAATRMLLERGYFPIAIGGGHDLTLPFARAAILHHRAHGRDVKGCVYFDAHLDVRPTHGSGMSFRRLIEDCAISRLYIHGFSDLANSAEHLTWFRQHGGITRDDPAGVAEGRWKPDCPYIASFDLDVIDAAHIPGVSAINPAGWSVRDAARWVSRLARDPGCVCFDLMELSPPNDPTGRSARVAAHLLLTFLQGFSQRGGT
ncbi:MAG: hypothetical protein GC200_02715 [Tepidisphaera sp.]|nr:hypothetical protein [Tepidisphaera sp.]